MSLRNFDLNLLITFEALVSECHVSRAAQKVFLSQSAMSHALNRLREQIADPILVRTDKGLQPTPRALAMLPEVRSALRLIERTIQPVNPFDPTSSDRVFQIACTDYFEAVVLPSLMEHWQQTAPNLKFEIHMIEQDASMAQLEKRQVDVVVGLDEQQNVASHLIQEPWFSEKIVCLASAQSPYDSALNLQEYVAAQHVVFSDISQDSRSAIDDWLNQQGLSRTYIARTVNYMAAARIVAKTQAIMSLPYQMALLFKSMLPLKIIAPPADMPAQSMTLISHPLFSNEAENQWLKQQLHQAITYL